MGLLTNLKRKLIASRFKRKNLNIIQSIPVGEIDSILQNYIESGWELAPQFYSAKALHQQGLCSVRRGQSTLTFTLEHQIAANQVGTIIGPARIVQALAKEHQLVALASPGHL
jgi:hypothetical protein